MYQQVFDVAESDDQRTKGAGDDPSCDSVDDDDSTGR
jgi:hypothetical protein